MDLTSGTVYEVIGALMMPPPPPPPPPMQLCFSLMGLFSFTLYIRKEVKGFTKFLAVDMISHPILDLIDYSFI